MTRSHSITTIFFLLTACHSGSVRTEPEPVTDSPEQPAAVSGSHSTITQWSIQPSAQSQHYQSVTVAIIDLAGTAPAMRDSTLSTIDFSLSIVHEPRTAAYTSSIEAFGKSGGTRFPQNSIGTNLPFAFTGHITAGQLTVDSLDCSTEISSALPVIQRALIVSPTHLEKDMTWTDSTTTSICSGAVPVSLTAVRSYRVVGETKQGETPAILLERQDRTSSTGEGTEGQHRIQIKSQGTGRSTILIDVRSGALIEMITVNSTTAAVTTSGRTQQFVQSTHERIARK